MKIGGMEAIWLKFTTTGLGSVTQLACDCQSLCQIIPNPIFKYWICTSDSRMLRADWAAQNFQSSLLPRRRRGSAWMIFSHGFIYNAPSVPGGKHHTTTSTWKSTLVFPAVRCSADVFPKRSHRFLKAWLAERAGPQEWDRAYIYRASFLKYSLLFYTF